MYEGWQILRWVWSATIVVYCVLTIIASKRLHGGEKKRNHEILIVMVVLNTVQILIRYAFGGLLYRFAVLFVGVAAGIAALVVARMLLSRASRDRGEVVDGEDRIQSLKLS